MNPVIIDNLRQRILTYWFDGVTVAGQVIPKNVMHKWFSGAKEFDDEIKEQFSNEIQLALSGDPSINALKETPLGTLSLILLLDQFTRNIYRNTVKMFSGDLKALQLSNYMIQRNWDLELVPMHRPWIYLPFEHSEDIQDQRLAVQKMRELSNLVDLTDQEREFFKSCVHYADDHKQTIERFNRFPWRNELLGRTSTLQELEYMSAGTSNYINPNSHKK